MKAFRMDPSFMISITNESTWILKEVSAWSKFSVYAYPLLFLAVFVLPLHFQIKPHGATSATWFLCLLSEKKIEIKTFKIKSKQRKVLRETLCGVVGCREHMRKFKYQGEMAKF